MRHKNRRHKLGITGPHRTAMMGNLAVALVTHGRIKTTLSKARALRPFIEKIITLAKKAEKANDAARKLHFRRLAIARMRDKAAVTKLFDELVTEFIDRDGGYTRIYKLGQRIGDAAEIGLIELIDGNDEGYVKKPKKKISKKSGKKSTDKTENVSTPQSTDSADGNEDSKEVAEESLKQDKAADSQGSEKELPSKEILKAGYAEVNEGNETKKDA